MLNKSTLIETIRIQDGRVRHISYHNKRCNQSRKILFGSRNSINLRSVIDTANAITPIVKCRITYNQNIQKVEYLPYKMKPINSLKVVEVGDYNYSHKYSDRDQLKLFYDTKGKNDDILMTKNGILTDSYYANIALLKKDTWYTPKEPLLSGTMRNYLIKKGKIKSKTILIDDINEYESIRLFNAMIPFGCIEFSTKEIE